jgi:hypothetical protein
MHAELAGGIEQTIDHQQAQHLLPAHRLAALRQTLLPELIEFQLLPQLACQPAASKQARPPQLEAAEAHRHGVQRVGGNRTILREQAHRGVTLVGLVEYLQRPSPRSLLLIVDLAQIQNRTLRRLAAGQTTVLDDAEVTMVLAVLTPIGAAQKHPLAAECQNGLGQIKREGLHPRLFPQASVESKENIPEPATESGGNCERRAKIGQTDADHRIKNSGNSPSTRLMEPRTMEERESVCYLLAAICPKSLRHSSQPRSREEASEAWSAWRDTLCQRPLS